MNYWNPFIINYKKTDYRRDVLQLFYLTMYYTTLFVT